MKKVLISSEDIEKIQSDIIEGCVWREGIGPIGGMLACFHHIKRWLDCQPDAALSKMETTDEVEIIRNFFKEAIKKLDEGLEEIYRRYPHLNEGGKNDIQDMFMRRH